MSFDALFDPPNWGGGLSQSWDTAAGIGSGGTFDIPRTDDMVTSNALQSMQPVENIDTGWTSFFRDITKGIVGYSLQKDAVQSGVIRPGGAGAYPQQQPYRQPLQQQQPQGMGGLMPLLMIGGLVVLLTK